MRKLLLFLCASVWLVGCASNPNAIEPNALERFDAEYNVNKVWSKQAGKGVGKRYLTLAPAVTDAGVYVADAEGTVSAYGTEKGKQQWRVKTNDHITGGVYAGDDVVIYGTREGEAVALAATDGEEQWRKALSSEVLSPPGVAAGMAVFQIPDGQVFALDLQTGDVLWQYEEPAPTLMLRGTATPIIDGGHVFVAFANGKVAALETSTGVPVWERRVAEPIGRSELERLVDINNNLIVEGGGVFASSYQGAVTVLDENSGQQYWRKDMSTFGAMASSYGVLFIADSTGHVWAIDQRSGDSLWKQEDLYGRGLTGVAVQNNQVVVGDSEGYLHWFDGVTGHLTARTRHHRKGFAAAPVSHNDVLYVYGKRGQLTAYAIESR